MKPQVWFYPFKHPFFHSVILFGFISLFFSFLPCEICVYLVYQWIISCNSRFNSVDGHSYKVGRAVLCWFLACGVTDSFLAFYSGSSCGCWIFEHFIGTGNALFCFENYQYMHVFGLSMDARGLFWVFTHCIVWSCLYGHTYPISRPIVNDVVVKSWVLLFCHKSMFP